MQLHCRTSAGVYVCIESFCPWQVAAHLSEEERVRVTPVEGEHNCLTQGMHPQSVIANLIWLHKAVSRHMKVIPSTRPCKIKALVQTHYHEIIDYQAALKV